MKDSLAPDGTNHHLVVHKRHANNTLLLTNLQPKTLLSDLDRQTRLFRSVVSSVLSGRVLAVAPKKSLTSHVFQQLSRDDAANANVFSHQYVLEEIVEGTMITFFYIPEEMTWEIATKKAIGGNYVYFRNGLHHHAAPVPEESSHSNAQYKKTFRDMVVDAIRVKFCQLPFASPEFAAFPFPDGWTSRDYINWFMGRGSFSPTLVNTHTSYTFVLRHPDNHLVQPVLHPELVAVWKYDLEACQGRPWSDEERERSRKWSLAGEDEGSARFPTRFPCRVSCSGQEGVAGKFLDSCGGDIKEGPLLTSIMHSFATLNDLSLWITCGNFLLSTFVQGSSPAASTTSPAIATAADEDNQTPEELQGLVRMIADMIQELCASHPDKADELHKLPGFMIHNMATGEHCNLENPLYSILKTLRGNDPNLLYRYLRLCNDDKVGEFLLWFPQYKDVFEDFGRLMKRFTASVWDTYVAMYITRTSKGVVQNSRPSQTGKGGGGGGGKRKRQSSRGGGAGEAEETGEGKGEHGDAAAINATNTSNKLARIQATLAQNLHRAKYLPRVYEFRSHLIEQRRGKIPKDSFVPKPARLTPAECHEFLRQYPAGMLFHFLSLLQPSSSSTV